VNERKRAHQGAKTRSEKEPVTIRPEVPTDEDAIRHVNRLGFGQEDEARLVDAAARKAMFGYPWSPNAPAWSSVPMQRRCKASRRVYPGGPDGGRKAQPLASHAASHK
jgi:hypothetical protein